MKRNILILIFLSMAISILIFAVIVYKTEPEEHSYKNEYGKSGNWMFACSEQLTGKGKGTKFCLLETTNGMLNSSGNYTPDAKGIVLRIGHSTSPEPRKSVLLKLNGDIQPDSKMTITVGDQVYTKVATDINQDTGWIDEEALIIIPALMNAPKLRYVLTDSQGNNTAGTQSLNGFTKVWQYAVRYTSHDPLPK